MLLRNLLFIRKAVTAFNYHRKETGRLTLESSAHMYDLGDWSLVIMVPADGCLFSIECSALFPMLTQLGCSYFIGTKDGIARIFIQ